MQAAGVPGVPTQTASEEAPALEFWGFLTVKVSVSPFATGQLQVLEEFVKSVNGLKSLRGERYGGPSKYRLNAFTGAFTTSEMLVSVQLAMYI